MKIQSIILLFLLASVSLYAQPPRGGNGERGGQNNGIKGKIIGTIIDSISLEPVSYASILLTGARPGATPDGTLTEDDGSFKFKDVSTGKYTLEISFIGYQTKTIQAETSLQDPDINLDIIYLVPSAVLLEGVTVVEEAALIENRIDKLVYNAEKDAGLAGADATELLRKVPMISVDLEGNISLRGSSNIRILINGRPSALMAESPADVLQTIPAEQIKSVEVITAPSAKYDGEGTAGIINIITKKADIEGFSGSVGGSVGTRSNNYSLNLSAVFGRFGLSANGGGWYSWPNETQEYYYREDYLDEGTSTVEDIGTGISERLGYRGSASAYYDFNAFNSLSSSVSLRAFNRSSDNTTETDRFDALSQLSQLYSLDSYSDRKRNGFEWTTDYRRKFSKKDQELAIAFQWDGSYSTQDNLFEQIDLTGMDPSVNIKESNENDGNNNEYTLQLDYTHPFSDWFKMEVGGKGVRRIIDSEYFGSDFDYNSGNYTTAVDRTDLFNYEQDVYAGYLSGTFTINDHWGMVAGGRYENTDISTHFESDGKTTSNSYANFLPSVIVSYSWKQINNLRLSYTQRIQRPGLRYINPYVNQSNAVNITIGNPVLDPELVDQVELAFGTFIKGISLNTSVYYRYTSDIIEEFRSVEDGIIYTNFENIGINRSIGLNIFSSVNVKKFLSIRGGFNVFSYNGESTTDGIDLSNQAILYNGNLSGTISLPHDFKIELFGFYRSPRQTLQGSRTGFGMYSFGVQKEFLNERASLGIRIVQLHEKYREFVSDYVGEDFLLNQSTQILFRSFGLSFKYKFGKLDFRERKPRSKIRNDDMKSDGDDNSQF